MIPNSREKDFQAKKEGTNTNESKIAKASSSSRQWSGLKDPRVVRVSRSFGGKDRHSKVCTVRGLRDRRVRLSVPTAIQLYDLQDRLGLNQPSKVVDWLLNAAKNEIDELPPLQIPPGTFGQYHQPGVISHEDNGLQSSFPSFIDANLGYGKDEQSDSLQSRKGGIKINDNNSPREDQATEFKSAYWNLNAPSRSKGEEVGGEIMSEKSSWIRRIEQDQANQGGVEVHSGQVSSPNPLSRPSINNSSFSGLLNNVMPYNSYYHWDPSNLSLSHLGSQGYSIQMDQDPHNPSVASMPPPLSVPLLCPSGTTPSFFSPFVTTQVECNQRQMNNHLQMLSSGSQNLLPNSLITPSPYPISQPIRSLQLNITSKLLPSQNNNASQSNKGDSGPF